MAYKIRRQRICVRPQLIPITDITTVSNYWAYTNFTSRKARNNKSFWYGGCLAMPIYFETPINSVQFRAYLRELFGIKESEHIEIYTSNLAHNRKAKKTVEYHKKLEFNKDKRLKDKTEQARAKMQEGFLKFMAKFAQKHKLDNSYRKPVANIVQDFS